MSTTSVMPTNWHWLRRLLSGQPHQIIGGAADPYLKRWYLIPRNPVLNVYLHQFLRSDDDRALHDHPWWFVSLMLRGMYTEVTEDARTIRSAPEPWRGFFGWRPLAYRSATWRHRVELVALSGPDLRKIGELPCWTLIITGRRVRTWGFWCPRFRDRDGSATSHHADADGYELPRDGERFIKWTEFGDAGCGEYVPEEELL